MLKEDNFDWNKFFNECESLVDEKKMNNVYKWLDNKGILTIQKYKEERKVGDKY